MSANPPVVFDVFGESCYVAFQAEPEQVRKTVC